MGTGNKPGGLKMQEKYLERKLVKATRSWEV